MVVGSDVVRQDLLIRGEAVAAVGDLQGVEADRVVDARGLLVLPGGVDTHVHFNDDFMGTVSVHDYLAGTRAAAFGGTTSVVDFSNQVPGGSLAKTLQDKEEEARGKALVTGASIPPSPDPTRRPWLRSPASWPPGPPP